MKVRLNFATAPLENHRRFVFGAVVIGGLALGALALLGVQAWQGWSANRALREDVARLEQQMRAYRQQRSELEKFFKQQETRELLNRAAFLNSLIEQRSFPWTKVFSDLERRLPEGVRVLTIAPQMRDGRVEMKLVVGAASDRGKLEFLKTLEQAPEFSRLHVVGESRPREGGTGDVVVLEIAALYDAAAVTKEPETPASGAGKPASRPPAKQARVIQP
jgi:Tfp pilus assembly protein PilN